VVRLKSVVITGATVADVQRGFTPGAIGMTGVQPGEPVTSRSGSDVPARMYVTR
jgi:hypothetical protein